MLHLSTPTRELVIDSLLFATLFYIIANKTTYKLTEQILPKMIKDRVLLHAMVYAMLYALVQKTTKRA